MMRPPTDLKISARIWFALAWRALLLIFIVRFLIVLAIRISVLSGVIPDAEAQRVTPGLGFAIWIIVPVFVVYRLQNHGFGRYRLAVLRRRGAER